MSSERIESASSAPGMARATHRTPVQIAAELGLLAEGRDARLTPDMLDELARRACAFDWVHLGRTDLEIGQLLSVIESDARLLPPRSGHMGNWEDIAHGRAGAMDFNRAIAGRGLGYALIYCFNQTEDAALQSGDWVYLPGSLVDQSRRTELSLFTWDGARFARRTREQPLFTPFVLSDVEGELVPITRIHWSRMRRFEAFRFRLEAAVIHEHESLVRAILHTLLEEAATQKNARRAFQDLLSHQVSLDGRMWRDSIERHGAGYQMGEARYASTAELVDATLLPFLAATDPEAFFTRIAELPRCMPIMSNLLVGMLSGMLGTHYPGCAIDRATMTQPFNPHVHWGARDMAGYPPRRKGYFAEKSTIRSARQICQTIVDRFESVDPLFMVLLPAAIFMLCPTSAHPRDAERMAELIASVRRATSEPTGRPEQVMERTDQVVRQWLAGARDTLSDYFLERFHARRGVLHAGALPADSAPVEPEGFRALTLRQACMMVGALVGASGAEPAS
jgi:hypothetical protein